MDRLHQLAEQGAPAGTAVLAEAQTGGRGSRGRAWHSPPGGLWLSVLYRPPSPAGVELLSLRLGLLVATALEAAAPAAPVALKWPNDLMVGDRKVGGILCEARWQGESLAWVAAGLGLNVTNDIPDECTSRPRRSAEHLSGVSLETILRPDPRRAARTGGSCGAAHGRGAAARWSTATGSAAGSSGRRSPAGPRGSPTTARFWCAPTSV